MTDLRPARRVFCAPLPDGSGFHPPVVQEASFDLNGDICWVTIPVVFDSGEGVTP